MPIVHILVQVLHSSYCHIRFYVDVAVEALRKIWVVWNNPPIIKDMTIDGDSAAIIASSMHKVPLFVDSGNISEGMRVMFITCAIGVHASEIWVKVFSTWSTLHMANDN